MPTTLLPASAAAFAPRSAPNIILSSRIEPWLTQALKRVNRTKRPINNVQQHTRCLTDVLSGSDAIWLLASVIVPRAPDYLLRKDSKNLLAEAFANLQTIHIEAYVVHVDMVSQNDVAFKLTKDTIAALIQYHKDVYTVDVAAKTWNWSGKEHQLKGLHEEFVQSVNKYVFRTDVKVLEGLEDEGAGELLEGRSQVAKDGILGMFLPLLPPPPRMPDILGPADFTLGVPEAVQYWLPPQLSIQTSVADQWRMISSPSAYGNVSSASPWTSPSQYESHLPSPASSLGQPFSPLDQQYVYALNMENRSSLPLPSVIAQQCGTVAGSGYSGYSWSPSVPLLQFPVQT